MKQFVHYTQIQALSLKAKEKLQKWAQENEDRIYRSCNDDDLGWMPLLSVGQMIEFLGNEWERNFIRQGESLDDGGTFYINNDKLCDALWEVVKETLEKP
jgi:hypothetical protein